MTHISAEQDWARQFVKPDLLTDNERIEVDEARRLADTIEEMMRDKPYFTGATDITKMVEDFADALKAKANELEGV